MNQLFAFQTIDEWVKSNKPKKQKPNYPIVNDLEKVHIKQVNKFKPLLPQKPNISSNFLLGPTTSDVKFAKQIIKNTAKIYNVTVKDIYNIKTRLSWVVRARQCAFYEVYVQVERMTYSELARMTGFHHTTIMHAILREAEYRENKRLIKEREESL